MNTSVSVKDFGAYGDGVHDDRATIQAALDSGAVEITIPQGIYPVDCVSEGFGSSPHSLSVTLLESHASGLVFRDFQFSPAADSACIALIVRNLTDSVVSADGITHPITASP
ncbi:MAG: hypothetical protein IJW71_03290 [Clostridia bacterium]|nr:hypothetical protein [Clostridia bacterium]